VLAAAIVAGATVTWAQQAPRDVTSVLSSSSLGPAIPRIAEELGLFEKHGLLAKVVPMDSGNTALAAIISRTAQAGSVGSGTIITAQARGQKVVAIASGYAGFATTMVLAKSVVDRLGVSADAPVAARLKAVDRLLIGTPEPTAGSTLGFNAAASVGAQMRFSYISQQSMAAALESGAIEGYIASAPWAGPILTGKGVVWISGPKGEMPLGTVNATSTQLQMLRETAEADPDLRGRLEAVYADFKRAINERPTDVRAATARVFPDLDPKLLDVVYPSESTAWNAPPLTVDMMKLEIDFVKQSAAQIPGPRRPTAAITVSRETRS
jgi:ABC-type nitrate/sulfonate/bicarbonate transport system substrate-binding protein